MLFFIFFFWSAWFSSAPLWLGKESQRKRKTHELFVSQERSYFINWTWTDEFGAWGKLFLLWFFFFPSWPLHCKPWGLLFQLNLVGPKICKAQTLSYSNSRVIQAGKSFPILTGSADLKLWIQSVSHTSENQCWIYWLSRRLLPLFANSTTIFLSSSIRVSPSHPSPRGAAPLLLLWSCLGIPVQPSRRSEGNHPETNVHFETEL